MNLVVLGNWSIGIVVKTLFGSGKNLQKNFKRSFCAIPESVCLLAKSLKFLWKSLVEKSEPSNSSISSGSKFKSQSKDLSQISLSSYSSNPSSIFRAKGASRRGVEHTGKPILGGLGENVIWDSPELSPELSFSTTITFSLNRCFNSETKFCFRYTIVFPYQLGLHFPSLLLWRTLIYAFVSEVDLSEDHHVKK